MFGLFKKDPALKLEKQYRLLLEQARDAQRKGDIKQYAQRMGDAESLLRRIETLRGQHAAT